MKEVNSEIDSDGGFWHEDYDYFVPNYGVRHEPTEFIDGYQRDYHQPYQKLPVQICASYGPYKLEESDLI